MSYAYRIYKKDVRECINIVDVLVDSCSESYDWDDIESRYIKIDFRSHRDLPGIHELDLNWWALDDYYNRYDIKYLDDEDIKMIEEEAKPILDELNEKYYWMYVDCYIHSWVSFSLSWEWMQCPFDTSKGAGIIACPKAYNSYDLKEWSESENKDKWEKIEVTKEDAINQMRDYIRDFDDYYNWCGPYEYLIREEVVYKSDRWDTIKRMEWLEDWCWQWLYNSRDQKVMEEDILRDVKEYLKEKWIEDEIILEPYYN